MELKKHITGFINNPTGLFIFYVIVNLLPSFGLFFTEPYDLQGKIILILFPTGLYFCLLTLARNTGLLQLIYIPLLIIHAFQIVVFYLFGEDVIAVDMFLNVVTTNIGEASEVLGGIAASVAFVVIIYIPTIVLAARACHAKILITVTLRRKIFISGVSLIVLSYILSFMAKNENTDRFTIHEDVYPINVLYNLNFAINKWKISSQYKILSENFTFDAHREKTVNQREIYVLVIGETSRADNWRLYGYHRPTTPLLANDTNIVAFNDVITQSNTTHKSVPIIMSAASAEDYNIIYKQKSILTAFKEAGFTTVFLSNQSANHTFTDYFAQEADHIHYYRHFKDNLNNYDEAMLPQLAQYFDSIKGDMFVIVHTYGSHFNYRERYPEEYAKFQPDQTMKINKANRDYLINAYDNTIIYTDNFLYQIITILEATNACTSMLYASDHGEDILDDKRQRFLHASPNPTIHQLRIPMFIWFSPVYKEHYPEKVSSAIRNKMKPVATNAIFHTLLDMGDIKTDHMEESLSLVAKRFIAKERMYLNDHDAPVPFYNAGLRKEDKDYIEQKSIHH